MSKEIDRQERLAEQLADNFYVSSLLSKSFRALFLYSTNQLVKFEEAEKYHSAKIASRVLSLFQAYTERRKAEIPVYSERQQQLGMKFLKLLSPRGQDIFLNIDNPRIDTSADRKIIISEKDEEDQERPSGELASGINPIYQNTDEEDEADQEDVAQVNSDAQHIPVMVTLMTERVNENRLINTARSINKQALQVVFNRWRAYFTKMQDFRWRKSRSFLKKLFDGFCEGVAKVKRLEDAHQTIEGMRDIRLVQKCYNHWFNNFQDLDQEKRLSELALQSYATSLLVKSVRGWRALHHTNQILSERLNLFATARGSVLLSRAFQSLSVHTQTARKNNTILSQAENHYEKQSIAKVFHSLKGYSQHRKEKAEWKGEVTKEILTNSLRLRLNQWRMKVWRRRQLKEGVETLQFALKLISFRLIADVKKVQEEKLRFAKENIPLVKRKLAFYGWKNFIIKRHWENETAELLVAKKEENFLKGCLQFWVESTRMIIEDRNRELAATGFYEIKILVCS